MQAAPASLLPYARIVRVGKPQKTNKCEADASLVLINTMYGQAILRQNARSVIRAAEKKISAILPSHGGHGRGGCCYGGCPRDMGKRRAAQWAGS